MSFVSLRGPRSPAEIRQVSAGQDAKVTLSRSPGEATRGVSKHRSQMEPGPRYGDDNWILFEVLYLPLFGRRGERRGERFVDY